MTGLELAFTILGEAATTEITQRENAQGFTENQTAARKGGVLRAMLGGNWKQKQAYRWCRKPTI